MVDIGDVPTATAHSRSGNDQRHWWWRGILIGPLRHQSPELADGLPAESRPALTGWEQLAQTLLASNEFLFRGLRNGFESISDCGTPLREVGPRQG